MVSKAGTKGPMPSSFLPRNSPPAPCAVRALPLTARTPRRRCPDNRAVRQRRISRACGWSGAPRRTPSARIYPLEKAGCGRLGDAAAFGDEVHRLHALIGGEVVFHALLAMSQNCAFGFPYPSSFALLVAGKHSLQPVYFNGLAGVLGMGYLTFHEGPAMIADDIEHPTNK